MEDKIVISDEEIRLYIKENSRITEYACWGPNKWYRPTREEAIKVLVARKKERGWLS
jgi:hypothetical protein